MEDHGGSMRTYRLEKTGNLDGLQQHDEPKPIPGRHEVLVRVRAKRSSASSIPIRSIR